MSVNALLEEFKVKAATPKQQLAEYKAQGKKVVGVLPYYAPEELVYAAGIVPMGMWGSNTKTISRAKEYCATFYCTIAQLALEMLLDGTMDQLDGIITPTICDTLRPMSQNFRVGMLGVICFGILGKFAIFNYFTTEPVRIAILLDEFLRTKFCTDFFNPLICYFDRICYIGNVLLEVLVVQQIIFREIIEGVGGFFQIVEFCPSFKSFPIASSDIRGDIDIQTSFSGQMLWCFCFITVFLQTGTDVFFRIITS